MLDAHIHPAGNTAELIHEARGHHAVLDLIATDDLDVEGGGQAEVDRLAVRINGVVVNMPEFKEAFACKDGQPMVKPAAQVCKVW